jgi:hypothetical protein
LPVASCTARTVTPGSTAPVESVMVPLSVASWAIATAGHDNSAHTTRSIPPDLLIGMESLQKTAVLTNDDATKNVD